MSEANTGDGFLSLLSNPEMLSSIAKLVSSAQSAPDEPAADASSEKASVGNAPDISDMLSSALSNPAFMAALPKMLGAISSMQSAPAAEQAQSAPSPAAPDLSGLGAVLPAIAGGGQFKKPPRVTDRRSALLLALKPYMSHDRADMIDTIVRIIEIMSLIK